MNKDLLDRLIVKAGEMAVADKWGEKALKINTMILEMDDTNSAACTRLAKYFKLHDNIPEAKNMYAKVLGINPNHQGAKNNLIEIEKYENEKEFIDKLVTSGAASDAARSLALKGKYELSIKCLEKAYSLEPLTKYVLSMAKIYRKTGKYEEIPALHKRVLNNTLSPQDIDVINSEFSALAQP